MYRFAVALCTLLLVGPAQAWGPLGHAIVADLAQQQLRASAQAEMQHLLAPEHSKSLASIASWADQMQNDPSQGALWQRTRNLHYVNFHDATCEYVPPRDCPDGRCVIAALAHYVDVLGDRSQGDAARREALKFVVHFVGDIHQPLHAGYRPDKGGNTYQVQFAVSGSNLHRVWDSGLLSQRGLDAAAYAKMLDALGPVPLPPMTGPQQDVYAQWASESCRITARAGFYPRGHKIGHAYVDAELPVADLRLRQAGRRLATVINTALGH